MNNKEFQALVAEKAGLTQKAAARVIETFAGALVDEITAQNSATVPGLGTFELKEKEQRVMFNPNTGKKMLIPPKIVVSFRQSPLLKTNIN